MDYIFPKLPKGSFEGYIFDCDGTVAHSMPIHFKAWRYALQANQATFEFTWECFRSMAGMGLEETIMIMNEKHSHSLIPEKVIESQVIYFRKNVHELKAKEEIVAIAREKKFLTHPISIASGGKREFVHLTLEMLGILDLFDIIVTQDDVRRCKPDPEIFLLAAEKMNIAPEKCLVFEDSPLGIQAAKSAGMQAVFIEDHAPDFILNSKI